MSLCDHPWIVLRHSPCGYSYRNVLFTEKFRHLASHFISILQRLQSLFWSFQEDSSSATVVLTVAPGDSLRLDSHDRVWNMRDGRPRPPLPSGSRKRRIAVSVWGHDSRRPVHVCGVGWGEERGVTALFSVLYFTVFLILCVCVCVCVCVEVV